MNTYSFARLITLLIIPLTILVGCGPGAISSTDSSATPNAGGGGGGTTPVTENGGIGGTGIVAEGGIGIGGTGITSGMINRFGSIYVNGVKFDTSNTEFMYGGRAATEAEFELGMQIDIKGKVHADGISGTADMICFDPTLMGKINSVSLEQESFMIGNTLVQASQLTILDGLVKKDFVDGLEVTVSGTVDASGTVHASHIKRGMIPWLEPILSVPTPEGTAGAADRWISGEGFVTQVNSVNEFEAAGWTITIADDATFTNGSKFEIVPGVRMIASGIKTDALQLLAKQLTFIVENDYSISGRVNAIDLENQILYGGANNIAIHVTRNTIMQDSSSEAVRRFGLENIQLGDKLNVYVYVSGDTLVAGRVTRVEPTSPTPPPELNITIDGEWVNGEGLVTQVNSLNEFEVAGWTVTIAEDALFNNGSRYEIIPGVRMVVSGIKAGDQAMLVKQLAFVIDNEYGVSGTVNSVDLENQIIYGGDQNLAFHVTRNTVMRDSSSEAVSPFGLEHIQAGDRLDLYIFASGDILAAGKVTRTAVIPAP